jgi:hypothetical protein
LRAKPRSLLTAAQALAFVLFWLALLNVVVLVWVRKYDWHIGSVHLIAQDLFKPLQFLNVLFFILLLLRYGAHSQETSRPSDNDRSIRPWMWAATMAAVVLLYAQSLGVNFQQNAWAHTGLSAGLVSVESVVRLFTTAKGDGFYRPMTSLSLWADYRVFGDALWGYHLQSIALHLINVFLVYRLGRALGSKRWTSYCGAILLGTAPFAFEAVLWPAARFDLLATTFELLALEAAIRYLTPSRAGRWTLALSLLFYSLSLLNKESAYSFPLVLFFLGLSHRLWPFRPLPMQRFIRLASGSLAITAVAVAIRILIYGNLGGYPSATGESAHFRLSWYVVHMSLSRVFGTAPFQINHTLALPLWVRWGIVSHAIALVVLAGFRNRLNARCLGLMACAMICAVPALGILSWVGPTAMQARYLYLPGVWIAMLLAELVSRSSYPRAALAALLVAGVAGTTFNLWVYRDMLAGMKQTVDRIAEASLADPALKEIKLVGYQPEPNGVFLFGQELISQVEQRVPAVKVSVQERPAQGVSTAGNRALAYCWQPQRRVFQACLEGTREP